jgi:ketosteroid isomerase-like protein
MQPRSFGETGERQGKMLDQNSVHLYHVANGKVTEGCQLRAPTSSLIACLSTN